MHSPHHPALHGERPANIICGHCFAARPANCWLFVSLRPVPGGESAGCVRLQWLVLQAVCLLAFAMPCPLPFSSFLPPCCSFCFSPCSFHVRQDRPKLNHHVCKLRDCPVGSCNTGLQWQPVRRFHLTLTLFPAESMILGHGCSVNNKVKMYCAVDISVRPRHVFVLAPAIIVKLSE